MSFCMSKKENEEWEDWLSGYWSSCFLSADLHEDWLRGMDAVTSLRTILDTIMQDLYLGLMQLETSPCLLECLFLVF